MVRDDDLTQGIIGAVIEVHRQPGPGLLESAYRVCLAHELRNRASNVREEVAVPVEYKGVQLECGYRLDLLVDDRVIVEIKSVERLDRIHTAQLISYLKLAGLRVGLLLNFNVPALRDGLKRVVVD